MPVPKTLTAKTEAPTAPVEPEDTTELEGELPAGVTEADRFDFERRRAALELAIGAREPDPVTAAAGYYGFLAGDKPAEETA